MMVMERYLLIDLLDSLLELREKGPHNLSGGICSNININQNSRFKVARLVISKWEKSSGTNTYPVPSPTKYTSWSTSSEDARTCYFEASTNSSMWEGEYGKSRYELLDFMIDQLTNNQDALLKQLNNREGGV